MLIRIEYLGKRLTFDVNEEQLAGLILGSKVRSISDIRFFNLDTKGYINTSAYDERLGEPSPKFKWKVTINIGRDIQIQFNFDEFLRGFRTALELFLPEAKKIISEARYEKNKVETVTLNQTNIESLPDETLINLSIFLPISDIKNLCQTNNRFNQVICQSDYFWKSKYLQDYGSPLIPPVSWKSEYQKIGSIYSFGSNSYGQLGLGNTKNIPIPTKVPELLARQVVASNFYSIIIDKDYDFWVAGRNLDGELGLPIQDVNETADFLPIPNIKAKQISSKHSTTLLIDLEDNVLAFGYNNINYRPRILLPTQIGFKAIQVAAGYHHHLIIDLNRNVIGIGNNGYGQLGLPETLFHGGTVEISRLKAQQVAVGINHSMVLDLEDNVWVFGQNDRYQLGTQPKKSWVETPTMIPNLKAKYISAGHKSSMVIDLQDNVLAFGENDSGQLGVGDKTPRTNPTMISGLKAKEISIGEYHTLFLGLNGEVFACGENKGQLGIESKEKFILRPTRIPGLNAVHVSAGNLHSLVLG